MKWDNWFGSTDGRPTMWVKRLISVRGLKLELHKMMAADDVECFHTHPAVAIRFVFWGGYAEELYTNRAFRLITPPFVGIVRPELCHRINGLLKGPSYSLWLRFPKTHSVFCRGNGWRPGPHAIAGTIVEP